MIELPDNFEYFDKKQPHIFDRLIKEQGIDVCQNMLHENYIKNKTHEYTFGISCTIPIANIGQKTRSKNRKTIIKFCIM